MSIKRLEASRYIRMEEMASTLYKIANENGPCYVNEHVTIMTTNVLSRMVFNKRFMGVEEQDGGTKMVQVMMFVVFLQNLSKFSNVERFLSISMFPTIFKPILVEWQSKKHGKYLLLQISTFNSHC